MTKTPTAYRMAPSTTGETKSIRAQFQLAPPVIPGPGWSIATAFTGLIDNPAYDPDGWKAAYQATQS